MCVHVRRFVKLQMVPSFKPQGGSQDVANRWLVELMKCLIEWNRIVGIASDLDWIHCTAGNGGGETIGHSFEVEKGHVYP